MTCSRLNVKQAIEFDRLSDQEVDELPELPLVVARCSPETKGQLYRHVVTSLVADGSYSPNDPSW